MPFFTKQFARFENAIVVGGYAKSTVYNYSRAVVGVCLYHKKPLLTLTPEEVQTYLYKVAMDNDRCTTSIKHIVYGLKFFLRLHDVDDKLFKFPVFKKDKRLPMVLSRQEVRRLISVPPSLKYRLMFALIYSAGFRIGELVNLKIKDVDFDRMQIRIVKGKGNKDRYVLLSERIRFDLNNYIIRYAPYNYLFNGRGKDGIIGVATIRIAFKTAVRKAYILKNVTVHTLRHSYATHMLEDGVDIVSIKEALGHSFVETTMRYLHVAKTKRVVARSPLDTLYED